MPWPIVYQTFDVPVVDVPRPCLAPVVHAAPTPGAPGACAADAGSGESATTPSAASAPRAIARGRRCRPRSFITPTRLVPHRARTASCPDGGRARPGVGYPTAGCQPGSARQPDYPVAVEPAAATCCQIRPSVPWTKTSRAGPSTVTAAAEARAPPMPRQPLHDPACASATFTQPRWSDPRTTATRRPPPAVADSAGSALITPPTRRQPDHVVAVRCRTHSASSVPTTATVRPPSAVAAAAGAVARRPPSDRQAPQRPPTPSRSQAPASGPRTTTLRTPSGATAAAGLLVAVPPRSVHPPTTPASVIVLSHTRLSVPATNAAARVLPTATAAGPPIRAPPRADQPVHDAPVRVRSDSPPPEARTKTCTPPSVLAAAGAGVPYPVPPSRSTKA